MRVLASLAHGEFIPFVDHIPIMIVLTGDRIGLVDQFGYLEHASDI